MFPWILYYLLTLLPTLWVIPGSAHKSYEIFHSTDFSCFKFVSLVSKQISKTFSQLWAFLSRKTKIVGFGPATKKEGIVNKCALHHSDVIIFSSNRSLWALLQRWGLRCESIPLESVQESSLWVKLEGPTLSKLNNPHTLHLWEISKHY